MQKSHQTTCYSRTLLHLPHVAELDAELRSYTLASTTAPSSARNSQPTFAIQLMETESGGFIPHPSFVKRLETLVKELGLAPVTLSQRRHDDSGSSAPCGARVPCDQSSSDCDVGESTSAMRAIVSAIVKRMVSLLRDERGCRM